MYTFVFYVYIFLSAAFTMYLPAIYFAWRVYNRSYVYLVFNYLTPNKRMYLIFDIFRD